MKSATVSAVCLAVIFCATLILPVAAQELPVILEVQIENRLLYVDDSPGPAQVARTPGAVSVNPATTPINHFINVILADVTSINGSPVKGVLTARGNGMQLTPTPARGSAISDVLRGGLWQFGFEFLKPDGNAIGSMFLMGLHPGPPAPGSPPGAGNGNLAIVGGTGAFLGARGAATTIECIACRLASVAEDPSMRRINGGGRNRWLIQLIPMFRPEVVVGTSGPAVLHSDFTPVTTANPARARETLIVYAKGLGPTTPSVNPGDPFPREPLAIATSPVEVLVNGRSSTAINQIGVPGSSDTYRVDFRVPDDTAAGTATVQISAAWVKGAVVAVPVR